MKVTQHQLRDRGSVWRVRRLNGMMLRVPDQVTRGRVLVHCTVALWSQVQTRHAVVPRSCLDHSHARLLQQLHPVMTACHQDQRPESRTCPVQDQEVMLDLRLAAKCPSVAKSTLHLFFVEETVHLWVVLWIWLFCTDCTLLHMQHRFMIMTISSYCSPNASLFSCFFQILVQLHCVSKKWGTHIMPHNSRKCWPILIILLLSYSRMNCRKRWY